MLNFVNFKNGVTCIHRHTLDALLIVLTNRLMSKLTDHVFLFGDVNRIAILFLVFKTIDKK